MRKYVRDYRRPSKSHNTNHSLLISSSYDEHCNEHSAVTSHRALSDNGMNIEQSQLRFSAHEMLNQQEQQKRNKRRGKKQSVEVLGLPQIHSEGSSDQNKDDSNGLLMFRDEEDQTVMSGWSKTNLLRDEKGKHNYDKKSKRSFLSNKFSPRASDEKKNIHQATPPKSKSKGANYRILPKNPFLDNPTLSSIPDSPFSKTSSTEQSSTYSSANHLTPSRNTPSRPSRIEPSLKSNEREQDELKINRIGVYPKPVESPYSYTSSTVSMDTTPFESYQKEIGRNQTKNPSLSVERKTTQRDEYDTLPHKNKTTARNNFRQKSDGSEYSSIYMINSEVPPAKQDKFSDKENFKIAHSPIQSKPHSPPPEYRPKSSLTGHDKVSVRDTIQSVPIGLVPPKPIPNYIFPHEEMELNEAGGISQILDLEDEIVDSSNSYIGHSSNNGLGKSRSEMVSLASMKRNISNEPIVTQKKFNDSSEKYTTIPQSIQNDWLKKQDFQNSPTQGFKVVYKSNKKSIYSANHDLEEKFKSASSGKNDKNSTFSVTFGNDGHHDQEEVTGSSWSNFYSNQEQNNQGNFLIQNHSERFDDHNKNVYVDDDDDSLWFKNQNNDLLSLPSHDFSNISDPRTWKQREASSNNELNQTQAQLSIGVPKNIEKKKKIKEKPQKNNDPFFTSDHVNQSSQKEEKIRVNNNNPRNVSFDLSIFGDAPKSSYPNSNYGKRAKQSLFESIGSNSSLNESTDTYFLRVVAAVVIQTFVRRYIAVKVACKRYSAVLVIQSFYRLHVANEKHITNQAPITSEELFDAAATLIQRTFRGWWVRDCLTVDNFCASIIQRNVRMYLCYLNYQYDLYCITITQSIVRRFIAISRLKKGEKDRVDMMRAATKIQSIWRMYDTNMNFIHTLADILIVQSVARRWIAMRLIRPHLNASHLGTTNCMMVNDYNKQPYNRLIITKKKKSGTKTKDLLQAWKSRGDEKKPNLEIIAHHPRRMRISRSQMDTHLFDQNIYRKRQENYN